MSELECPTAVHYADSKKRAADEIEEESKAKKSKVRSHFMRLCVPLIDSHDSRSCLSILLFCKSLFSGLTPFLFLAVEGFTSVQSSVWFSLQPGIGVGAMSPHFSKTRRISTTAILERGIHTMWECVVASWLV